MKIWKMNQSDWVAAETLEDAKQGLANTIGDGKLTPEFEAEYIEDPYEIGDNHLDTLKLTDEDDLSEAMGDDREKWDENKNKYMDSCPTFRQALQKMIYDGVQFPTHFAATDI